MCEMNKERMSKIEFTCKLTNYVYVSKVLGNQDPLNIVLEQLVT